MFFIFQINWNMLKIGRKGVTANDSESLGFVYRILAIGFHLAIDLLSETISRAWVAKYLKRMKKIVQLNWSRFSYESAMDSWIEKPALSQESNCKLSLSSAITPSLAIFSIFQLIW